MNEFVVEKKRNLTPQQMVVGVMGISMEQLIDMIRENRDGRFDCLFKETAANQAKLEAPV